MSGNYDEIDINSIDGLTGLTDDEIEVIKNEFDNIQRNKINPADMIIYDVKRIKETKKIVNEFLKTTKKTNKTRINLIDKLYDDGLVYTVSLKQPKNGVDVKLYTPKPCADVSIDIENIKKEFVSFTNRKTINDLTEPFSDSIEFSRMVAQLFYLLGGGKPIVQRIGNFREGHRSSSKTSNSSAMHFDYCAPSCNCTPGDISLAFPARIMDNLWESLKTLDKIVPGILHQSLS